MHPAVLSFSLGSYWRLNLGTHKEVLYYCAPPCPVPPLIRHSAIVQRRKNLVLIVCARNCQGHAVLCSEIEMLITSSDFRVIYLLVRDGDMLVPPSGRLLYFLCQIPNQNKTLASDHAQD